MSSRYRPELADRYINRLSPANVELGRAYLTARRAEGVTASTCITFAKALLVLDRHIRAESFRGIEPAKIATFLAEYRLSHAASSVHTIAAHTRAFFTWLHEGELPAPLRRAFKHKRPGPKNTTILTNAELESLLRAVSQVEGRQLPANHALHRAVIWGLWDSGMRISELLSLRVGGCVFDERGGARLTLPPDGVDLKTGPRSIYVVECVGPIRAWLAHHPNVRDREAPLFPSPLDGTTLNASTVARALAKYCQRAGVRHVHPHLFRHTRATRAAEAGWNEAELRSYFGWAAGSAMASHYVHLAAAHMEERVRHDSAIDPIGARIREDPKTAMAELVASTLQALGIAPQAPARYTRGDDDAAASPAAHA